mgnify:CR=1 FL=1
MRRAGVEEGPLSRVRNVNELGAAVAQLTDAQLIGEWLASMSNEELLARLEKARAEPEQEDCE